MGHGPTFNNRELSMVATSSLSPSFEIAKKKYFF